MFRKIFLPSVGLSLSGCIESNELMNDWKLLSVNYFDCIRTFYHGWEKELRTCKYLCACSLSTEVRNLEAGKYVLCNSKETNKLGTINLFFKNGRYEKIPVSELKDYPYL